jgi:hypothetical protein
MSKGIVALTNEIAKKEHRASPLGQLEQELWKFYDNRANRHYFESEEGQLNPHMRWVDIHRATTRSKQTNLEREFEKESDALVDKYAKLTDDLLIEAMQTELDYLTKLNHE